MADSDNRLDKDEEFDRFMEDYERRRDELHEHVSAFMDEKELDEGLATQILLDLTINMRMVAYAVGVERPSSAGLKLDLDRFRGEIDAFIREAKKSADDYIRSVKDARAAAETDDDSK
jgi:hypothetical protein